MITFLDGSTMTDEEMAQTFEAEGRLIVGVLVDHNGDRCAAGVIGDYATSYGPGKRSFPVDAHLNVVSNMVRENNAFIGTPEERAAHMAAWARSGAPSWHPPLRPSYSGAF